MEGAAFLVGMIFSENRCPLFGIMRYRDAGSAMKRASALRSAASRMPCALIHMAGREQRSDSAS